MRRLAPLFGALAVVAMFAPVAASADDTVWLCKPGIADNPCDPGLDTTFVSPSGDVQSVKHIPTPKHPQIDCFYVYPTVSDQATRNADRTVDPEERSIALYQAARYSEQCRVFAPMYRQITVPTLLSMVPATPEERALAYGDVLAAWKDYLHNYNHGRGVVLIGHSQGTFVLRQLIADEVDKKPSVRRRMISAILLGGNVTVKDGRDRGGDFKHIRACHSRRQLHCVTAFSTFNEPVPSDSLFGRTTVEGLHVLCNNPAKYGDKPKGLKSIVPAEPFAPGTLIGLAVLYVGMPTVDADTPFYESDGAYAGQCSSADGANVLQITDRPGAAHLTASPDATWGLHLVDANIALGNLIAVVKREEKRYLTLH